MGKRHNPNLITGFALHVAMGGSIAQWSAEHKIPGRTCRDWTKTEAFQAILRETRQEAKDRAIGLLTRAVTPAVAVMIRLACRSKDENVKLSAAKALTANLLALQTHEDFERRLAALEAEGRGVDAIGPIVTHHPH